MEQEAAAALGRRGRARDHHDRRALGAGAGDRVDQVERAGAVGHRGDAEAAADPRRAVGREPHARLVRERMQRQDARLLDHLEQRQSEIARDAEDPGRTVILERVQQGLSEVHRGPSSVQAQATTDRRRRRRLRARTPRCRLWPLADRNSIIARSACGSGLAGSPTRHRIPGIGCQPQRSIERHERVIGEQQRDVAIPRLLDLVGRPAHDPAAEPAAAIVREGIDRAQPIGREPLAGMADLLPHHAGIAQDHVALDAHHVPRVPFLGQRPRPAIVARAVVKPDPDQRQDLPPQMLRQRGIGGVDLNFHRNHS